MKKNNCPIWVLKKKLKTCKVHLEAADSRLREKDQVIAMLNNRCEAYKEDAEAYSKLYESADGRTDAYNELIAQKDNAIDRLLDVLELQQREINTLRAKKSGT